MKKQLEDFELEILELGITDIVTSSNCKPVYVYGDEDSGSTSTGGDSFKS